MTEWVLAISLRRRAVSYSLGICHAGHGFVDQQQLRVLRQQHADLQPLLLSVREICGEIVALGLEPDRRENFVDALAFLR